MARLARLDQARKLAVEEEMLSSQIGFDSFGTDEGEGSDDDDDINYDSDPEDDSDDIVHADAVTTCDNDGNNNVEKKETKEDKKRVHATKRLCSWQALKILQGKNEGWDQKRSLD